MYVDTIHIHIAASWSQKNVTLKPASCLEHVSAQLVYTLPPSLSSDGSLRTKWVPSNLQ